MRTVRLAEGDDPLLTVGGNSGEAHGFNSRGQVVGTAENIVPDPTCPAPQVRHFEAVVWKEGEIEEILPTFHGDPDADAVAINDKSQAVGASGNCTTPFHALLWQNGTATNLGNLGGTMGNVALDINNRGQVVGTSDLSGDTTFHAFLWQNGTMNDLGTVSGDVASVGDGINSKGQVVGGSFDINGNGRAYFWQNGVMTDLNTLIPAGSPLFLIEATGTINDRGQIAGFALQTSTGEVHAFLLTPSNDEVARENAMLAARGERSQRPKVVLPENVRCCAREWPSGITFLASEPR